MINSITINNIQRLDKFILFTTFDGLIVYDTELNSWYHNYKFLNINNRVLWDALYDDEHIYFSSSNGMIICDYLIIDGELKIYKRDIVLSDSEIYSIENVADNIYFSSSNGIFSYEIKSNEIKLIDENI